MFEKELTRSDVSKVGRIVLPKKEAEGKLPVLNDKRGIELIVRDALSSDKWTMKYRFWPNNKSKMYVLENTGEFVKKYNLTSGDSVAIYQDGLKQNFICAKKRRDPPYPLELQVQRNERMVVTDRAGSTRSDANSNGYPRGHRWGLWDGGFGFNDGFTRFSNQSPTQCERFPSLDDVALFLFDN